MYLPINSQTTCASAWLEATKKVNESKSHEANNVIIDISKPCQVNSQDEYVIETVDNFLCGLEKSNSLNTVANTIFPQAIYDNYGSPEFYEVYKCIFKRLMKQNGQWGRYFDRMICRITEKGDQINPLQITIDKLKSIVDGKVKRFKNIFELDLNDLTQDISIYDPCKDANRLRNRQCLSFMSFKLENSHQLNLTAIYRYHYYIDRLLGNLIGLARLMKFVAQEASVDVGQLTVVSTHAKVDTPSGCSRHDIKKLLNNCTRM